MRSVALSRLAVVVVLGFSVSMLGCGSSQTPVATAPIAPPAVPALWMPKSGDLRFQGLGAYSYSQLFLGTGIPFPAQRSFSSYAGTPLQLGSGVCGPVNPIFINCYWFFSIDAPPVLNTTAVYTSGYFSKFSAAVDPNIQGNTLVTSLDIQLDHDAYATAQVVSSTDSGYKGKRQHVAAADLAATVQSLTANGSVVTALAPDSDEGFQVFSYIWGTDMTSKYEATVLTSSIADVATSFQALTAQGYILSALGGTRASGMRLVGTRLVGQTAARPSIISVDGKGLTFDPLTQGYVTVGWVFDDSSLTVTRLIQK